ncbi:MAG: NAD(P)H-binding protein [Solirubrobacteraceae bacterium]|nr:NAD(P)H-binding protein [Solirubrobacteraceae bacterium]
MQIAVPGGTGMLGRPVVEELVRRGHDVRVLTRTPPSDPLPGAEHHEVDLVTGAGLDDALAGVDAVIEAANTPGTGRKATPVLVEGTRRLLQAEARAGVGHHVAISIVGIDAVPFSYYRAKLAQEQLVQEGPVAWSIVRATQFHQLLDWTFASTARAGFVPANGFAMAPVDPRFVARALVDAAQDGPGGRLAPVAGPQVVPVGQLARQWASARRRRRPALPLPLPRRARRALRAGGLVPAGDDVRSGGPSFGDWLRSDAQPRTAAVVAA